MPATFSQSFRFNYWARLRHRRIYASWDRARADECLSRSLRLLAKVTELP